MYRAILFIQRKGAFGAWRGILFYINSYVLQLNYFFLVIKICILLSLILQCAGCRVTKPGFKQPIDVTVILTAFRPEPNQIQMWPNLPR